VSSRACASLVAQSLARSMTAVIPCQVAPVSSSPPPWQTRPPLQPELPSRTVQNLAPPGHPGHLGMGETRRVLPNSAEPPEKRSRQLQFQLRSPPFATVRPAAVRPFPRRSESLRTGLNPRTSSWKACWGQPLTSSNLVSSASASPGTTSMAPAACSGGQQRVGTHRRGDRVRAASRRSASGTTCVASTVRG
jgi:hypothetical protein